MDLGWIRLEFDLGMGLQKGGETHENTEEASRCCIAFGNIDAVKPCRNPSAEQCTCSGRKRADRDGAGRISFIRSTASTCCS